MRGSVSYARIADRYERVRGGEDRARQLAGAVIPWLPSGGTVCDVGAGTGVVSARFAAAGLRVVGFDLSVEMIRQAAPRLPGRVAVADASALPLRDAAVDAVLFVWVLHHVADVSATLHEARRVLRPGGRVIAVSGTALPADDEIDPIFRELSDALRPERLAQAGSVVPEAERAGFCLAAEAVATVGFLGSPEDLVANIEQRLYAHLWDVDDATWASVVQPRIDALRALPDPGRPRRREIPHPLWVLERLA